MTDPDGQGREPEQEVESDGAAREHHAPEPGEQWVFHHGGAQFEIEVTELALGGNVVHGRLLALNGQKGAANVIVPTTSVLSGERVPASEPAP